MIFGTIAGNLGQDAEVKTIPSGETVTSFSVASSRKVKGEESTTWVRCSMWGKRGPALAQYLTKGSSVTVVGELSTREYDDKNGVRRFSVECHVSDVKLQGGRVDSASKPANSNGAKPTTSDDTESIFGDNVPF